VHTDITQGLWNLISTLDRQKYFNLMENEKAMELMRLVKNEIYRI
jgi:xylose isomerase